jgi:hypothetical protein
MRIAAAVLAGAAACLAVSAAFAAETPPQPAGSARPVGTPEPVPAITVTVSGPVAKRGPIALAPGARLSDALAAAGLTLVRAPLRNISLADVGTLTGPCRGAEADMHHVLLVRGEGARRTVFMFDAAPVREGSDPPLRDGDGVVLTGCFATPPPLIRHETAAASPVR